MQSIPQLLIRLKHVFDLENLEHYSLSWKSYNRRGECLLSKISNASTVSGYECEKRVWCYVVKKIELTVAVLLGRLLC